MHDSHAKGASRPHSSSLTDEVIAKAVDVFGPELTLTLVKAHERSPRVSLLRDIANGDIIFKQRTGHDGERRDPHTGRWSSMDEPKRTKAAGSNIVWTHQDTRESLARRGFGKREPS